MYHQGSNANVPIWIDAIFIFQNDDQEKEHQVALMRNIYGGAREVKVWLGEAAENNGLAFALLRQLSEMFVEAGDSFLECSLLKTPFTTPGTTAWEALAVLLRRPWLSRMWIVQEVVLALQCRIACGDESMPWGLFANLVNQLKHYHMETYAY